jgi:hypothetical protein
LLGNAPGRITKAVNTTPETAHWQGCWTAFDALVDVAQNGTSETAAIGGTFKSKLGNMWGTIDYQKRKYFIIIDLNCIFGAGGGTRTPTGIRPSDFKSGMSTIPSRPHGPIGGAQLRFGGGL